MEIKVSAILISKNVKPYIRECLQSVCDQTMKEIEILCIDAFSNDGTREVINEFASRDSRVKLLDDDKGSTGYSNNIGVDNATGEYIAFIETDDFIKPDMFETLYKVAKEEDCDYVKSDYCAFWTTDENERIFRTRKTFEDNSLYGKVINPKEHIELACADWYVWKGLYKKDFLTKKNISFSETKGAAFQDIGFLYQTTTKAERAVYLSDCHYCYCIDRDDASSNSPKALTYSWQEFSRIMDNISNLDTDDRRHFYARMAKSFICCCRGIASIDKNNQPSSCVDNSLWFYDCLNKAIADGYLNKETIGEGIFYKLDKLLNNRFSYIDLMKNKENEIKNFLGDNKASKVVIFGCGGYGYSTYRWLTKNNYSVLAYLDNDKELWRKKVNNIIIDSPDNASSFGEDVKYIIANENHFEAIRRQLIEYGINDRQIYVYE